MGDYCICPLLYTPGNYITWQWKTTIFDTRYIFKWLFFHCHVGFQWCRWILFPRRFIYRYRSSWFTSSPAKKVGKNDDQKKNRSKIIDHPKNHWILLWRGLTLYSRVLGSPNHQFWDPMILRAEGFFQQIQAFSRSKKSTEKKNLWIWRPVPPPTRLVNMDRGLMTGPPW